jgi:hypothetical protein
MMTDRLDERARRAGAAVHARTADMDADRGLATVVRRGRRPRPITVIAVLLVLGLSVPGVGWLRGLTDTRVELESPADAPQPEPTTADEDPAPPEEAPTVPTQPQDTDPEDIPTAPAEPEDAVPEDAVPEERPAAAGPDPAGPFGTQEVSDGDFPFGGGEYALLTDVRVAGHDGFDRVVLQFDGADMPSYRVTYVHPPIVQDGSGDELHVDGTAFVELRLTPASGFDSVGTSWEPTYHGPNRVTGDTAVVTEVVRTGDFEANLAWVVGLRTQQPFAVTVLPQPLRLVVDIQSR